MTTKNRFLTGALLLSAWGGASLLTIAVVAPGAFRALPSRGLAGAMVGQVLPTVFVSGLVIGLAVALLAEASLSFLGLGVQPPQPSWGAMLARAYNYMEIAPEQMYAPGLAIMFTALAFNTLGEALRVALDPTAKRR
jgi:ABC-type dipeptide/oligopeptide/nickel transport system permease subunit